MAGIRQPGPRCEAGSASRTGVRGLRPSPCRRVDGVSPEEVVLKFTKLKAAAFALASLGAVAVPTSSAFADPWDGRPSYDSRWSGRYDRDRYDHRGGYGYGRSYSYASRSYSPRVYYAPRVVVERPVYV